MIAGNSNGCDSMIGHHVSASQFGGKDMNCVMKSLSLLCVRSLKFLN